MEELAVGPLRELATRSRILIGHSPSGKNSFMGHMTCLQLFNQSLEAHVIKALRLCLNKHGNCLRYFSQIFANLLTSSRPCYHAGINECFGHSTFVQRNMGLNPPSDMPHKVRAENFVSSL